ncbi:MAG: hypothetical protein ACM3U2_16975 [Deltaproteobacteria bacterium]
MIGSTGRRWKLTCIAGAGLACLGAGTILISGCSTTTVSDARTSAKTDQEVAGTSRSAAGRANASGRKGAQQVAAKNPPGRVRISDLDGETRVQMAARVGQYKSEAGTQQTNPVATASRGSSAAKAGSSTRSGAQSQERRQVARRTVSPNAASQRPTPSRSTRPQTSSTVAASTKAPSGSIRQTSGAGQSRSASASRSAAATSEAPPVITPRKTEWQPENGGEKLASNHERKRADRLMQRAYAMYESGYREEALRLASVAAELEYSQLAVYKRGEERPSDFVEFLLTATSRNNFSATIETAPPAPGLPSSSGTDRFSGRGVGRGAGAVLPAEATGLPQAARDLQPADSSAPRVTTDDKISLRAAANAGQIEVPVAKPRDNADASVVTAAGNRSNLDEPVKADGARSVVTADQVEEPESALRSPKVLASKAPEPAAALPDADIEALSEAENSSAAAPPGTSHLTIASLVGLLAGIAGMLGLGWWRRQERQHYYAGGK